MNRRDFIKVALVSGVSILVPNFSYSNRLDLTKIEFSKRNYNAQTIIIYMYGGASSLAGNLTNLDEIKKSSQSSYSSYFGKITKTKNNFWSEAGGEYLEKMLNDGDMTIFRTCYSAIREKAGNKAHGVCTEENQKGSFNIEKANGIIANLAAILKENSILDDNSFMPFITMEGDSKFYEDNNLNLPSTLKAAGIDENFNNPYDRVLWSVRNPLYYTKEEKEHKNYNKSDKDGGFEPAFNATMDRVALQNCSNGKIKDAFIKRGDLANFINDIKNSQTPDLGEDAYPQNNNFAKKLEAAIKILNKSPNTKVITLGTGGLGGWDDHNNAKNYLTRSKNLFKALRSAVAHLKAIDKINDVNILVFSEFGRNVNLNSANGWDHGNLQNLYIFGGHNYFNHQGVVGETKLDVTGKLNRLWLKPKDNTYWFEPLSIAATIYKIYGINNPQILTNGYEPIDIF